MKPKKRIAKNLKPSKSAKVKKKLECDEIFIEAETLQYSIKATGSVIIFFCFYSERREAKLRAESRELG